MNYEMPMDPFANDPNDPASFLEDEAVPELSESERLEHVRDLIAVEQFSRRLSPYGFDGVMFLCGDCNNTHFYEWDIMAANIRALLAGELPPVHEPGAEVDPHRYVPWEYAQGFLDGLNAD